EQMDRSGTRGRHAHADFPGELGVRARHERGLLFVADLNEIDFVVEALQRADQSVYAVAGIAVDSPNSPLVKPVNDKIADSFRHLLSASTLTFTKCRTAQTRQAGVVAVPRLRSLRSLRSG